RAARRRNLLHSPRGPNRHRELAAALQHDQAARIARIQAASSGGICPCLRRVAGCATPTGSAGHASAPASLKLTFRLDHSVGANQATLSACPLCAKSGHDAVQQIYSITSSASENRLSEILTRLVRRSVLDRRFPLGHDHTSFCG